MRIPAAVTIGLIMGAALFLRLWHLGEESIWLDEAHTCRVAHKSFAGIVDEIGRDRHPPFYFLVAKIDVALLGDSERALRFPSVLFALPGIALVGLIARRLYDRATALAAMLLVAVSPFHIHYAQEARAYALLFLLTALSYYFLIELGRRFTRGAAAGYVIASAVLLYTHFFGVIHLAAQNLIFLAAAAAGVSGYRANLKRWLIMQGAVVLLFTPWLGFMIPVVRARLAGENTVIPAPGLRKLIGPFITYSGSRAALVVYGALALAASLPLARTLRRGGWRRPFIPIGPDAPDGGGRFREGRALFLLVWLAVPIVVPIVLSRFVSPFFITRYTIGGSIAFYILVAAGITSLPARWARVGAVVLAAALGLAGAWRYHQADNKEAWRDVAAYVDESADAGDLLLFSASYTVNPFDYYSTRPELARRGFPPGDDPVDETSVAGLDSLTAGFDRVWLIEAYGTDAAGLVPKRLERNRRIVSREEYARTSVAIGKEVTIRVTLFRRGAVGDEG